MKVRHAAVLGAVLVAALAVFSATSLGGSGNPGAAWATRGLAGSVRLHGQVPLAVSSGAAHPVGQHASNDRLTLSFGFPLRDQAGLNRLIQQEATTHLHLTRAQLYARFSPPQAQVNALRQWLVSNGFRVTHVGADRLMLAASASTATVQRALHVQIADFVRPGSTFKGVTVKPYIYYANTTAPTVPARLGLQSISGLSNVDRFFTDVQLYKAQHPGACDDGQTNPQCVDVRSGGYYPVDLQSLYDITGHGYNATGQTLGFTLWTTPERQAAMTAYATTTGDQPITVDMPSCVATGNSPTTPSSCSGVSVQPDHLLTILENGNSDSNANFGSNVETALDIEAAHGVATHAALKYYADGCASTTEPGSGLSNAGCNGSDVGMEEAMEDAANDPTLHSVSNSWGYGGEAEWGTADPFMITTGNILALGAAAGTSFYFSTGDAGTYQSGWPTDSPYVVSVGGTSLYSTSNSGQWSTSTEWSGSGSWCSNIVARPSWQTAPGLASRASCPGRVSPDVSADADPNTGVRFTESTNLTGGTSSGQVGGTSLAAPIMNGLQADTQNFVNAQTYPGPTPQMGFVAPMLYQIGNSGNAGSYYRDIQCGNTANPTSGPDGDAAAPGWDPGSGWGEPDWFQFSTGYALQLGATNLSVPPSLSRNFRWSCAQTPSNSSERAFSCPTASTCYAVGAASGATPWYGKFLPSGAWGAVNTFFKSADGGKTWFPSNSDMFSIACTGPSTCLEVGAGGRERSTSDGGTTWSDVATAPGNNKPLTQVQCPSSSVCYAAGDRGNVMKSTDGGQTWSWLQSTGANPIYGLSCPTASVCYAADIYAHILKTTDGGSTWTWQSTPITTPGVDQVAETGGPNPFAGLLSISCSTATTCVATGLYVVPSGQTLPSSDPPIITTTDGGATWVRQTSNAGQGPTTTTTTLAGLASAGDTNIKVASVNSFAVGQSITVDSTGVNSEQATVSSIGTAAAAATTLAGPSQVGATNIKVASITGMTAGHQIAVDSGANQELDTISTVGTAAAAATTLAAASLVGDTNIKVTSVTGMTVGHQIAIDTGANLELDTIASVGTAGSGGTGVTLTTALVIAHASGAAARDLGSGVTLASPLTIAHASGAAARDLGTGVTLTSPLSFAHASGATVAVNAPNYLHSVSCVPGATNCAAVGRNGKIVTTADLTTWFNSPSGTTNFLNSVTCLSTTFCMAVGQNGTVDIWNGASWTATTGNGGTGTLASVTCQSTSVCYATGKQGVTIATTNGGGSWAVQAGGGTTNQMNGISCPGTGTCFAAGNAGTILKTSNGGQTWSSQASGTTNALNAIACASTTACTVVGAAATGLFTTDGSTWSAGTTGTTNALNGVACPSTTCFAVGASGTILGSVNTGSSWSAQTSGTSNALNAIACTSTTRCYVAGASGTILRTTNGGSLWVTPGSGTTQALNGVACSDDLNCIVDSSSGSIFATSDGSTWSQQGEPISGPTTALNATSIALNGAFCTSARCMVGTGAQGDILITRNAPITTASVAPPSPDGLNGWYVTAPTVTLSAVGQDAPVAATYYTVDGGTTQPYLAPFQVATDGTHTVSFWSSDTDGFVEAPHSITLKVDLNNPTSSAQISPPAQNGWYASPTVTLTGNDGSGSGVASISYKIDGVGSYQTYTGPLTGFSTGNHFVQFFATDVAGRVESPVNLIAFKADSDKPTVNIVTPADGASYRLNSSKNASYKCADKQSGLASCVGTVPVGSPIDTSTIGTHSFTVTGTDLAGNQTVVTVHYQVVYTFQGFFSPIGNEADQSLNLVHAGDLIKVGFGLDGDQGLSIGTFSSTPVACPSWAPHLVPAGGLGTAPGLSYGVASGHYTYGWQTSAAWAGTCRQFSLQLNDGTPPHTAVFMFFA